MEIGNNAEWNAVCDRGIVQKGNLYRFQRVIRAAAAGERLKIGFLGGSITQGSLATAPEKCYAYLVYRWWQENFPQTEFVYLNEGIGATTSQFGVARVEQDLLVHQPDVVFLEFSVNDTNNEHFKETFEGLVRKILQAESAPALFMFHNVQYNDGVSAQEVHSEIGRAYGLPIVSIRDSIYAQITAGRIKAEEITPDNLHPNDLGHRMVAGVICHLLDVIKKETEEGTVLPAYQMPEHTVTKNRFEGSRRYQNYNMPACKLVGFEADHREQHGVSDVFKHGYRAMETGSSFEVSLEDCSRISVQFRRTIQQPAPKAKAVVDGKEENAVYLDANFDETWGDCCTLQDITGEMPCGRHTLRITIVETPEEPGNDFYLISVLTA